MNPYHIPFVIFWHLSVAWWNSPWYAKLISIIITTVTFLIDSLKEEGPVRVAALARRFSWLGYPVGILTGWWLAQCLLPEVGLDHWDTNKLYWILVGYSAFVWFLLYVVRRRHCDSSILRRAYRRIRFRLRWDSIAKSAGLSHIRDIRPAEWITGGTRSTIGSDRVQWVPTLWRGRRLRMGDGVEYLFRPARGLDNNRTHQALEAIAIAANGHSATFTELPKGKWMRNWWRMTIYWTDPAAVRPSLNWSLSHA